MTPRIIIENPGSDAVEIDFCGRLVCKALGNSMVLAGDYDPAQLWLPFINALVIDTRPPPSPKPKHNPEEVAKLATKTWATVADEDRVLFRPERGVPQYTLPFLDHQRLTKSEFKRIKQHGCPAWDTMADGRPIEVAFKPTQRSELEEWCRKNCTGKYHLRSTRAYFERSRDAALVKVTFGC